MTLPFSNSTFTVLRPVPADPYEPDDTPPATVGTVAGVLSSPKGRANTTGGQQEVIDAELACNPIDLRHTDLVRDNTTGNTYSVVWTLQRYGLGLDHLQSGLRIVDGVAA